MEAKNTWKQDLLNEYQRLLDDTVNKARHYHRLSQITTIPGMRECHQGTSDGLKRLGEQIIKKMASL